MNNGTILIRNNSFSAEIYLVALSEIMPIKARKLFTLAATDDRNAMVFNQLDTYFPEAIPQLKAAWLKASEEYQHGRKRRPKSEEDKAQNSRLAEAVKSTKAAYARLMKIQTIYESVKETYK